MTDYEVVLGEVEGYRAFEARADSLCSIGSEAYSWIPGRNRAHCALVGGSPRARKVWVNNPADPDGLVQEEEEISVHGRIPSLLCSCGFYLLKSQWDCRERFPGFAMGHLVMGKVKAWGRVIEHEDGYRVEFAKIVALVTDRPSALAALLDLYDVEAIVPRTKSEEGLSTAWVTRVSDGEPQVVKLNRPDRTDVEDELGEFRVEPGVILPPVGSRVTVRFDRRGGERWITEVTVHEEEVLP